MITVTWELITTIAVVAFPCICLGALTGFLVAKRQIKVAMAELEDYSDDSSDSEGEDDGDLSGEEEDGESGGDGPDDDDSKKYRFSAFFSYVTEWSAPRHAWQNRRSCL